MSLEDQRLFLLILRSYQNQLALPDTEGVQNAVGVSGFDCLSSEGGFEVEAADGEAVDVSGNVEGLFPIVLRFAEWAPTKTDFEDHNRIQLAQNYGEVNLQIRQPEDFQL